MYDRGLISAYKLVILEEKEWSYISFLDRDKEGNLEFFQSDFPRVVTPDDYEEGIARWKFEPSTD